MLARALIGAEMTEKQTFTFCVGETGDGQTVVFSTSEPVFCFFVKNDEEARQVGINTVQKYLKVFRKVEPRLSIREEAPIQAFNIAHAQPVTLELAAG